MTETQLDSPADLTFFSDTNVESKPLCPVTGNDCSCLYSLACQHNLYRQPALACPLSGAKPGKCAYSSLLWQVSSKLVVNQGMDCEYLTHFYYVCMQMHPPPGMICRGGLIRTTVCSGWLMNRSTKSNSPSYWSKASTHLTRPPLTVEWCLFSQKWTMERLQRQQCSEAHKCRFYVVWNKDVDLTPSVCWRGLSCCKLSSSDVSPLCQKVKVKLCSLEGQCLSFLSRSMHHWSSTMGFPPPHSSVDTVI